MNENIVDILSLINMYIIMEITKGEGSNYVSLLRA